ncbi:hypothetical protein FQA39_LY12245 [Lamprigera yunnana]|nr:hypothetical protein FQA39_LY12245 [Lamprigera yunnana]
MFYTLLLGSLCIVSIKCGKLPPDMKTCHRSDADMGHCLKDAIQDALPKLKDGIPSIHFSPIEPFIISDLTIGAGGKAVNVVQNYKNMIIHDLTKSKINSAKVKYDSDNFHGEFDIIVPYVKAEADYTVDGKVMMFPVQGNGKCSFIFKDVKLTLEMHGSKFEKKGVEYLKIQDVSVKYVPKHAEFHFDNLFNGDKELGDAMNKLINDNWHDLFEEVRGGFEEGFTHLFKHTTNAIFTKVPLDELFPQ